MTDRTPGGSPCGRNTALYVEKHSGFASILLLLYQLILYRITYLFSLTMTKLLYLNMLYQYLYKSSFHASVVRPETLGTSSISMGASIRASTMVTRFGLYLELSTHGDVFSMTDVGAIKDLQKDLYASHDMSWCMCLTHDISWYIIILREVYEDTIMPSMQSVEYFQDSRFFAKLSRSFHPVSILSICRSYAFNRPKKQIFRLGSQRSWSHHQDRPRCIEEATIDVTTEE